MRIDIILKVKAIVKTGVASQVEELTLTLTTQVKLAISEAFF